MFKKQRIKKALQKVQKKSTSGIPDTNPNKTYIQMWQDHGLSSKLIKPAFDEILLSLGPFGAVARTIKRKTGREDKIKLPNSLMEKLWIQSQGKAKGNKESGALEFYLQGALEQSAFVAKKVLHPVETLNDYLQRQNIDVGAIEAIASAQKETPMSAFEVENSDEAREKRDRKKLGLFM